MLVVYERHLTTRFINSLLNNIYKYNNIIVLEHIGLNFEEYLKHYIDNYLFIDYIDNHIHNLVKVYINHDKFELIKKHLIKSVMFFNNYENWIRLVKYTFEINNIKLCKNIIYYSMKGYIPNGYTNRITTKYYYELSYLAILYNNPKILRLIIHNIDNKNEFIELKSFAIRNKCNYQIIELIEDNFKKLN